MRGGEIVEEGKEEMHMLGLESKDLMVTRKERKRGWVLAAIEQGCTTGD